MVYDTNIDEIVARLEKGEVILYPTDTIWGIGCDATNNLSIKRIFQIKGRKPSKPFLVLVSSLDMLKNYVEHVHPRIETLLFYHKRPLTLIYEKAKNLPSNAIAEDGSIGIRVSLDPFINHLINTLGKPIISTSANIADQPSPAFYMDISTDIKEAVDYIVPFKQNDKTPSEPSVIAKLDKAGELVFLRE